MVRRAPRRTELCGRTMVGVKSESLEDGLEVELKKRREEVR
jgi:hypothetical protein